MQQSLPSPPLTVHEVGNYLGVGDDVVRRQIRTGKLKAIKVGGHWRIFRDALMDYMMARIEKA